MTEVGVDPRGPRLAELRLKDWRCHHHLEATPGDSYWVVLVGDNGAGKTSILEAIYATARGRSFRAAAISDVICSGHDEAQAVLCSENGSGHALGLAVRRSGRELHLDRVAGATLAQAATALPVEYVSGDAYQLVNGPPAVRRRFLDWVLFHVEPRFLAVWHAWRRAHRQRNAALRRGAPKAEVAHWVPAVAAYGEELGVMREALIVRLNGMLADGGSITELDPVRLAYQPGWRETSLAAAFSKTAGRERQAGRAVVGPQYDDWQLRAGDLSPAQLSRGQAKLVSFLLYRAQTRLLSGVGRTPLLLIDDLAADLDAGAIRAAMGLFTGERAQVWLSVLPRDRSLPLRGETAMFHVEPGVARRV